MARRKLKLEALRAQLARASPDAQQIIQNMVPLASKYDVRVIFDAGKMYPAMHEKHPQRWTASRFTIGEHLQVSPHHVERGIGCFKWWAINRDIDHDNDRLLLVSATMMNVIQGLLRHP